MTRWGRDPDDVREDLAYAIGEGMDPIGYLRRRHEARGWTSPHDGDGGEQDA